MKKSFCTAGIAFLAMALLPMTGLARGHRRDRPWWDAVKTQDRGKIQELLEKGIDPDLKDDRDHTALMLLAAAGDNVLVGDLLKAGADPNAEGGTTALFIAVLHEYVDIARSLIDAGARIEQGMMLAASRSGNRDLIGLLLPKFNARVEAFPLCTESAKNFYFARPGVRCAAFQSETAALVDYYPSGKIVKVRVRELRTDLVTWASLDFSIAKISSASEGFGLIDFLQSGVATVVAQFNDKPVLKVYISTRCDANGCSLCFMPESDEMSGCESATEARANHILLPWLDVLEAGKTSLQRFQELAEPLLRLQALNYSYEARRLTQSDGSATMETNRAIISSKVGEKCVFTFSDDSVLQEISCERLF